LELTEVLIVDEQDRELPRGAVGEIVVRGDDVLFGRWLHTGDGGYLDDDGRVHVVDRIKDMIVCGGEYVYSAEVENALARHPAVASCAVVGVPDAQWGERVHAVVVLAQGKAATGEELRAHVAQHLAGYKAPRSVEFVAELPGTGS
jgi:acyl-CoA synthetase (AMP-forming)/AMP-acid ligase II